MMEILPIDQMSDDSQASVDDEMDFDIDMSLITPETIKYEPGYTLTSTTNINSNHVSEVLTEQNDLSKEVKVESPPTVNGAPNPRRPRHDVLERKALLALAVKDVINEKISMRKASLKYNLAKSSLCDYVRKNNIELPCTRVRSTGNNDRTAVKSLRNKHKKNGSSPISVVATAATKKAEIVNPKIKPGPRPIAPKSVKIESPWSSSAGLPTQVPLSSWGVLGIPNGKLPPLIIPTSQESDSQLGVELLRPSAIPMAPISSPETDCSVPVVSRVVSLKKDNNSIPRVISDDTSKLIIMKLAQTVSEKNLNGFLDFVNKSPSLYHVVCKTRQLLLASGFREIREDEPWMLQANDRVFFSQDQANLVAVAIGGKYKPGSGFTVVGCHTDSPCLKVKPQPMTFKDGSVRLKVTPYGSGNWSTWFERDLGLAGRCVVRNDGHLEHRLVSILRPILRIPYPSESQSTDDEIRQFSETDLSPVLCYVSQDEIPLEDQENNSCFYLRRMLADELKIDEEDIVDMELNVVDFQSATVCGDSSQFVNAPRIDNLFNVYSVLDALIHSMDSLDSEANVRVSYFFGSGEAMDPRGQTEWISHLREAVLSRLTAALHGTELAGCGAWGKSQTSDLQAAAVARSCLLWTVQTNVVEEDDEEETQLAGGIVLRHGSSAMTASLLKELALSIPIALQEHVVSDDATTCCRPVSWRQGLRTVQAGGAVRSLHSCREVMSVATFDQALLFYRAYFEKYPALYASLKYLYD